MIADRTLPGGLWLDGTIILLYFGLIIFIGLRAGRNNSSLKEFSLGGRSIPWWAVLASIVAAETSAATFLGTPAEGYKTRAFFYGQLAIGTVIARVVIAFTFIGPYYRYGVESIYEFLMVRFGPRTKNAASGIFLFTRVLGIGVRLYLGGLILVVVWRYLFPTSQIGLGHYFWGILLVTLITTGYTMVGGIKAVVWTDLIQACLMLGWSVLFFGSLCTASEESPRPEIPSEDGNICAGFRSVGTRPSPSEKHSGKCFQNPTQSLPR